MNIQYSFRDLLAELFIVFNSFSQEINHMSLQKKKNSNNSKLF